MSITRLDLNLPQRGYSILIGDGALADSAHILRGALSGGRAAVVSDETVWSLHGGALERRLNEAGTGFVPVIVPPGEGSKSLAMLERLCREFARFGLKRGDPVIAFGGGVVGDLAGFAASVYMRGTAFIQIPTTLLAQVDSSVGGKVAVNLDEGKNLIGAFYQPELVIADTSLLSTLPEREWKAGLAEVAKYAAIGAEGLLPLLNENWRENLRDIVYLSCKDKAGYVERDERDTGLRMALNFGHTFGHAIEKLHGYRDYNHGEAVAIGMMLAVRAGEALGVTPKDVRGALSNVMEALGLSWDCRDSMDELIPLMAGDKKNTGADITLILLENMGTPVVYRIGQRELIKLFREDDHDI